MPSDKITMYVPVNLTDVVMRDGHHYSADDLGGPVKVFNFNVSEALEKRCTRDDRRFRGTPTTSASVVAEAPAPVKSAVAAMPTA